MGHSQLFICKCPPAPTRTWAAELSNPTVHGEPSPGDTPHLDAARVTLKGHTIHPEVCNLISRGKTFNATNTSNKSDSPPPPMLQDWYYGAFFMHLNTGSDSCYEAVPAEAACSARPRCGTHPSPALWGKLQVQLFCFCCAAGFGESSKFPKLSQILI